MILQQVILRLHRGGMSIEEIAFTMSDLDRGDRLPFLRAQHEGLSSAGYDEDEISRQFVAFARLMASPYDPWARHHGDYGPITLDPQAKASPVKVKISRTLSRKVFERDLYRCVTCGTHLDLSCDHIVPESKGGPTTFENLQTMCRPCNSRKGAQ